MWPLRTLCITGSFLAQCDMQKDSLRMVILAPIRYQLKLSHFDFYSV